MPDARSDGRYLILSKVLLAPKATRLLSPLVEKQALEAAPGRNYRPAAAELGRWLRTQVMCAILGSEAVRTTRAAMVAGPGRAQTRSSGGDRVGFHLPQAPTKGTPCQGSSFAFSDAPGAVIHGTQTTLHAAGLLERPHLGGQTLDLERAEPGVIWTTSGLAAAAPLRQGRTRSHFK
jgi:hypothetical protein